jgi:very-short-patch-repair endonuclease
MEAYNRRLKQFSRALRSNMTDAELRLWQRLRNKQLCGVQFYRQKPLLSFIVDFYCPKAKLVIELDGAQHFEPEHQARDKKRDESLAGMGLKVLRFDDMQVLRETDAVLEVIYAEVMRRLEENSNPPDGTTSHSTRPS